MCSTFVGGNLITPIERLLRVNLDLERTRRERIDDRAY
jgi:hypothetical protein